MLKKSSALLALIFVLTSAFSFCVFAEPENEAEEPAAVTEAEEMAEETESETETEEKAEETESETETEEKAEEAEPAAKTEDKAEEKADAETEEKSETESAKIPVTIAGGGVKIFSDILGFFTKYLGYIAGILVFALIVKIILFPLSIKQQKNSQKMAKLAPKQEAIRKKYAGRNDRATQMKMNEEIQRLYAEEKFNPMGGCLPMLLQLPIILLLYTTINSPLTSMSKTADYYVEMDEIKEIIEQNVEDYGYAPETKKINITQAKALSLIANATYDFDDLSEVDEDEKIVSVSEEQKVNVEKLRSYYKSFNAGPINLMETPRPSHLLDWIIPLLTFLSSFFSTKLIRKFTYNPNGAQADASMKLMDWTMPLMILFFSFQVAALIGVYWIFQNIISIGQQFALSKLYPVKAPTPEEIREAELLMRGKKSSKRDDDDERSERKQSAPAIGKAPIKKKKSNSPFIYAKKGIDDKYLAKVKAKGVVPKAKMKP